MSSRGTEVGGSGWSMFAGVFLAIAGLFNALDGLVALVQKEYFNEAALVYQNMQVWGWVFLIVGIVQLVVGWQVISRAAWARWVGVVIAIVEHDDRLLRHRRVPVVGAAHHRDRRHRRLGPHGPLGELNL